MYHEPAMQRIWNYNPKIKLLILLRNPVERAFAHWNMQRYRGREPLDFFRRDSKKKKRALRRAAAEARRFAYLERDLWTPTRTRLQIFSARANEGREIRRLKRTSAKRSPHLLVPRP